MPRIQESNPGLLDLKILYVLSKSRQSLADIIRFCFVSEIIPFYILEDSEFSEVDTVRRKKTFCFSCSIYGLVNYIF